MSVFGRIFGSSKPPPKKPKASKGQELNNSISTIKGTISQLEKREALLEKKIAQAQQKAKERMKNRDKKGATFELKKKKQYEKQLEQLQSKKLNLETQIMALEDACTNAEIMKAMRTGADAMKGIATEARIERAEDVMEDITEAMGMAQELNDAMAQPLGMDDFDEDELDAELAELEDMEADEIIMDIPKPKVAAKTKPSVDPTLDMPAVPSSDPVQTEEDEMAELEAMMG